MQIGTRTISYLKKKSLLNPLEGPTLESLPRLIVYSLSTSKLRTNHRLDGKRRDITHSFPKTLPLSYSLLLRNICNHKPLIVVPLTVRFPVHALTNPLHFLILLVIGLTFAFIVLRNIPPLRQLASDLPLLPPTRQLVSSVTFYVLFLFVALTIQIGALTVFVRTSRLIFPAPNNLLRFTT